MVDPEWSRERKTRPVEIKYKRRLKPSDFRGLEKFRDAYPDRAAGVVVNLGSNRADPKGFDRTSPFEPERYAP